MSYDPRRAALLCLCVVAVLVAATQFPVTGLGSAPEVVGSGPVVVGDTSLPEDPATSGPVTDGTVTATATAETPPSTTATATPTTETPDGTPEGNDPDTGPLDAFVQFTLVFVLLLVGTLVVAPFAGYERRGWWLSHPALPDLPPAPVRALFGAIPGATMDLTLGLADAVPRFLGGVAAAAGETARGLSVVLGATAGAMATLFGALPRAFGGVLSGAGRGLGALFGGLPSALAGLGSGLGGRSWSFGGDGDPPAMDARSDTQSPQPPPSVEEAWRRMTRLVGVRNRRATTAGEYARAAVERGLPADAVGRLTGLFQEVRYGGFPGDESRTQAARDALASIRAAVDRGEDA